MKSNREGLPSLFEEPKKERERRSLLTWYIMITLAVSSGNLMSAYFIAKAPEWNLIKVAEQAIIKIKKRADMK